MIMDREVGRDSRSSVRTHAYRQEMGITRKTAMVAQASSSSHNIWEFQLQKINNTIKIHFISQGSPRLIKIGWVGNMGRGQAEK
jgi:hypothetical protein